MTTSTPLPEEVTKALHQHFSKIGKVGGTATAANMTQEERTEKAKKMARKRWEKKE